MQVSPEDTQKQVKNRTENLERIKRNSEYVISDGDILDYSL